MKTEDNMTYRFSDKKELRRGVIRKKTGLLSILMIFCMVLTSCGHTSTVGNAGTTVFKFGGQNISFGEVYIYAETVIEGYKDTYGENVFSMDITDEDGESRPLEEVAREDIIKDIVRVKVLNEKAENYDVALTNEDKAKAVSEADHFWKGLTDQQIADMQLTQDMVQKVIVENIIADKVYKEIINTYEVEISDEKARETTFYDIYFTCYKENPDGSVEKYTEEARKQQYQNAVNASSSLNATDGINAIDSIVSEYGLTKSAYYTMTPDEIQAKYGSEVSEMLYDLEDGTFSLVTETEYGYHIFYMKYLTDRAATDSRKEELLAAAREEYFQDKFNDWLKDTDRSFDYEKDVNFDEYNKISFE